MSDPNDRRYHRRGGPGGPGCAVTELPVSAQAPDGTTVAMTLLSAGENATEVELLRTIVGSLGIRWGQDDFGWWAAVPDTSRAA